MEIHERKERDEEMENQLNKTRWTVVLAAALLLSAAQAGAAGIVVIGNPGLSVDSITAAQATEIFLGKMPTLKDGTQLTVIEHQDGEPVRDEFYEKVVGKSPSQLKAYWAKIVFTGEGFPPKAYSGDKAVKERVAATPGAIGYVEAGAVDKSVKVLFEGK